MGLAGPIFPLVVRHEMPARPALGTGAYAIGLVLGATVAAAVVVPLAGDGVDWRFALAVVTLAGLGSLAVWLGLAPSDEVVDESIAPAADPVAESDRLGARRAVRAPVDAVLRRRHVAGGGLRRARLVRARLGEPRRAVRGDDAGRDDGHAARRRPDRDAARAAHRLVACSSSPGLIGVVAVPEPAVAVGGRARSRDGRDLPDRPDAPRRRRRAPGRRGRHGRAHAAGRLHPVGDRAIRVRRSPAT